MNLGTFSAQKQPHFLLVPQSILTPQLDVKEYVVYTVKKEIFFFLNWVCQPRRKHCREVVCEVL